MRLSEAILLGSLTVKPMAGKFHHMINGMEYACAIGMAENAIGCEKSRTVIYPHGAAISWPWMLAPLQLDRLPCGCGKAQPTPTAKWVIIHLFDLHVMGDCDWTIEALADWIRSVEPEEAEAVRVESPRNEDEVFGQATPVTELASANLKNK